MLQNAVGFKIQNHFHLKDAKKNLRKRDLYYLASPYTATQKELREDRFNMVTKVSAQLVEQGFHVYSPIMHCHPMTRYADLPTDWEYWKIYCRKMLQGCSGFIALAIPGWYGSVGMNAELEIAKKLKMPIFGLEIIRNDS